MNIIYEIFENSYSIDPASGCWLWHGSTKKGVGVYPMIASWQYDRCKKKFYAKRIAFEKYIGEIPDNISLTNECNNQLCVNPYHLKFLTHKDKGIAAGESITKNRKPQVVCKNGHEYALFGRAQPDGYMRCYQCKLDKLKIARKEPTRKLKIAEKQKKYRAKRAEDEQYIIKRRLAQKLYREKRMSDPVYKEKQRLKRQEEWQRTRQKRNFNQR